MTRMLIISILFLIELSVIIPINTFCNINTVLAQQLSHVDNSLAHSSTSANLSTSTNSLTSITTNVQNLSNVVIKVAPPEHGVYQGAITDFGGTEDNVTTQKILSFENLIGKKIVWSYFSNNWGSGIKFPEKSVKIIHSLGIVPFIRMMPRTTFTEETIDPNFTLQRIIDGKFDNNLTQWARDAKRVGIPIMVEFGTEVNGHWFPWSGILNGGGNTSTYGDPKYPDGPERFKDAYIHIINLFRKEGVNNITWCFHIYPPNEVGGDINLHQYWNDIKNYYPGDDYIDWIGTSIYGADDRRSGWESFTNIMDDVYPSLTTLSHNKPLAVFEFGVLDNPLKGNKTKWILNALSSIQSEKYPRIKAISYWNEKWNDCIIVCVPGLNGDIDLMLNSSSQVANAYKKVISSSYFLTDAQYHYTKEIYRNQSDTNNKKIS